MKPNKLKVHFFGVKVDHGVAQSLLGPVYETRATGYSIRAVGPSGSIIWSDTIIGPSVLGAIGAVRNHVEARSAAGLIQHCTREPIYTAVGKPLRAADADPARCCEIDLTAAYLTAARDIGALDRKMYGWILEKFSKESRLKIIGSLGTNHTIRRYEHGKEVGKATFRPHSEVTRAAWDSIVAYTDKIMATLRSAAGRDFVYYWADAIFVRPAARARVAEKAKDLGFGVKTPTKIYTLKRDPSRPHTLVCSDGRPFSTPAMKAVEMMRKVGL